MNSVFIATSIDSFISDRNGGLDWLHEVPNPGHDDMGYANFINRMDAIVMGRVTFETVLSFGIDWPYKIPVFVLSKQLNKAPENLENQVFLVKGPLDKVLTEIHGRGFQNLYIDGGTTIRNFLRDDLIDELILTTIPVLLGGGTPLFGALPKDLNFDLMESKTFLNKVTQRHYKRITK